MNKINELGKYKYFANKGIKRHKHPIANLIYKIELSQLKSVLKLRKTLLNIQ